MQRDYRVLLVEDTPEQADLLIDYLKLDGRFAVVWVRDIESLWGALSRETFDILLLDFRLPDGTGLDALSEITRNGHKIPVVMVTGQGDEIIATQAMQRGAADYVVKNPDYFLTIPAVIQKVVKDFKLQQAVEQSLEKIRYQALILNNVRDAVIVWSVDGRITFWNQAAEILFGWPVCERLERNVKEDYFPHFDPVPVIPCGNQPVNIEEDRQLRTGRGKLLWINSKITSLHTSSPDGNVIGYMDVSRDITDRKRMEAEIRAAQTQLIQSARLAAIGELASGIAHRISNPLAGIIANAQLLLQGREQFSSETLEDIYKAGWRAQEVVKQLLEFSRPASGNMEMVSVNQTIQNALGLVGAQIENQDIQLVYHPKENIPAIHGNARQLEDLWLNLLLLARDAVSAQGAHCIRIATGFSAKYVWAEVFDDGQPIPEDMLPTIFEPDFVQANIGRGTGLELSICREIVRQHKGVIRAASSKKGTTFQIAFPIPGMAMTKAGTGNDINQ